MALSWFLALDLVGYGALTWLPFVLLVAALSSGVLSAGDGDGSAATVLLTVALALLSVIVCCCAPAPVLLELLWRPQPAQDPQERALLAQTREWIRRAAEAEEKERQRRQRTREGRRRRRRRKGRSTTKKKTVDDRDGERDGDAHPVKLCLLYRAEYDVTAFGLERLHPFDAAKYEKVAGALLERGVAVRADSDDEESAMLGAVRRGHFHTSSSGDDDDDDEAGSVMPREPLALVRAPCLPRALLVEAHSARYLASLHSALVLLKILEVPPVACLPSAGTRWRVLSPMLFQCGGTCAAVELAVTSRGAAINLGGGFHHASRSQGCGFSPFADISMAIRHARAVFPARVDRCLIVDLDAHQGNGHERDAIGDDGVFVFDVYNRNIFPGDGTARQGIDFEHGIGYYDSDDASYLRLLEDRLPLAVDAAQPDLIIYNAGTDCMDGDPLGNMQVSPKGIVRRDEIVLRAALSRREPIPVVMVLSGGYQPTNAAVIANSIENLANIDFAPPADDCG